MSRTLYPKPTFSLIGTVAVCFCCFFGMFALQLISVYVASLLYHQLPPSEIGTLILLGSDNGTTVALSVFFTALMFSLIALSLMYFKISRHQRVFYFKADKHTYQEHIWQGVWQFFGVKAITLSGFIISLISLIILMVISEIITLLADKSPMDFLDGLVTPQSLHVLIIAVVIIAPIYEELIFRGLIFGAITHVRHANHTPIRLFNAIDIPKNTLMASLVSSVLFTLVHLQYDSFGMMLIFSMALLFAFIRIKYGLIMAILIHMINNGVAMMLYLAMMM